MSQSRLLLLIAGGALLGSVAGSVGLSFADNLASTSTVLDEGVIVPYDGYLMLDSAPVNATAQNLRFSLYESSTGGTAQWVETQTVSVNGGKFSVALGKGTKVSSTPPNAGFDAVILDAQKLYIGIEVDDGNGTFIELAGRQAIEAAPFAAWAAKSADFEVARDLNVQRNTQLNGGLGVVGDTNIGGQVVAREFNGALTPRYQAWGSQGTGDGGAGIYNDNGTYDALMVVGNDSGGGQRQVRLYDDVTVNSDLNVSATASVGGRLTASSGLTLGNDQSITGVDVIQGFNDLRLFGDPNGGGSGDLFIAADGKVTAGGNFRANGKYENLGGTMTRHAHGYINVAGVTSIGVNVNEAVCFLGGISFDHTSGDPGRMGCQISTNGAGDWILTTEESPGLANTHMSCLVRCIRTR